MFFQKRFFLFLFFLATLSAAAQSLLPVTRFFPPRGGSELYADEFLSGFLQSARPPQGCDTLRVNGFLQMPFIGDPLLVYIGEKDSTQFTAYATSYQFRERRPDLGCYAAHLYRYGIEAQLTARPAYVEQTYHYPDTTAVKGFLLDIDHALSGEANEDMDVVFIDRQSIRAWKRSREAGGQTPQLYYYAHFSVPFDTWNIRRERVSLENGRKESRCKAAFTFKRLPGDSLRVLSAVSALSSNDAYACVRGHRPARLFDDTPRRPIPPADDRLLAQQTSSSAATRIQTGAKRGTQPASSPARAADGLQSLKENLFDISTRDASLRTAFFAALAQLRSRPELQRCTNAADFLQKLAPLHPASGLLADADAQATDSLLRHYAAGVFRGGGDGGTESPDEATARAAWFVFNAIGFRPDAQTGGYRLVRPAFNVATLLLPRDRRLTLYVRRASPSRCRITAATLQGSPLPASLTFAHDRLVRGGILDVKMDE